jgi:hypothetical protein
LPSILVVGDLRRLEYRGRPHYVRRHGGDPFRTRANGPAGCYVQHVKNVRANPKCRRIEALTRKPVQEAAPAIIAYFADPDGDVRLHAQTVPGYCFRREAQPYMKEPLSSRDRNTLIGAMSVVGTCRYSVYKQQVRDIARSADDVTIQLIAVATLWELEDQEGLRGIARSHPRAEVRRSAERMLANPLRPTPANISPPAERPNVTGKQERGTDAGRRH